MQSKELRRSQIKRSVNLTVMGLINSASLLQILLLLHINILWSSLLAQCPRKHLCIRLNFAVGDVFLFFIEKRFVNFERPKIGKAQVHWLLNNFLSQTWVAISKLLMQHYVITSARKVYILLYSLHYWIFLQLCDVHSVLQ